MPASSRPAPSAPRAALARVRGRRLAAARLAATIVAALLWGCIATAAAQLRATIDREQVALDESVVLQIEIDSDQLRDMRFRGNLEFAAIERDFDIINQTTRQQVEIAGRNSNSRFVYSLELVPKRTGLLTIPSVRIGDRSTPALRVTAVPPAQDDTSDADVEAFIEAAVDNRSPYVQQSVGYVLRLVYDGSTILDGRLDQDAPEGAGLIRIGDDVEYSRAIRGRGYKVLERRYLLVPERAGRIVMPAARFDGRRTTGNLFDDMLGDDRTVLKLRGPSYTLQARSIPAAAPQPWLPLRGLALRYFEAPRSARVGEAATVTIEAVADGASAAQLPELTLSVDGDAQVLAEAPQIEERFADGRLRTTVVRSFAIVPNAQGRLRVVAPRIAWWDTQAGSARSATLPDLLVPVAAPLASATPAAVGDAANPVSPAQPDASSAGLIARLREHVDLTVLLIAACALLATTWLGMLLWMLHARRAGSRSTGHSRGAPASAKPARPASARPTTAPSKPAPSKPAPSKPAPEKLDAAALRRLIDTADLGEVADALCRLARPPAADLDRVRARLDDPVQREAIDLLQRARWGGAEPAAARAALRSAFAAGPRWRQPSAKAADAGLLPPLYPR
jgi:BatD DUF11 like domain